jgi:hypothetical protein
MRLAKRNGLRKAKVAVAQVSIAMHVGTERLDHER